MYFVIIEVTPNLQERAVVDVFSIKPRTSGKGIDILKLLVIGEPANNFWYVNVLIGGDIFPSDMGLSNLDRLSFKIGKEGASS